jgi:hypothetical protein
MAAWRSLPNGAMRRLLGDSVLSARERIPCSSLPTAAGEAVADRAALARLLVERLTAAGLDVLCADLSPPGARVAKAIRARSGGRDAGRGPIGPRNLRRLLERGGEKLRQLALVSPVRQTPPPVAPK